MPILSQRHDEKRADGKPVYIVKAPNPITAKRCGVQFFGGTARTMHLVRAIRLAEDHGYDVLLPKGHKNVVLAVRGGRHNDFDLDEAPPDYAVEDELDEEEAGAAEAAFDLLDDE